MRRPGSMWLKKTSRITRSKSSTPFQPTQMHPTGTLGCRQPPFCSKGWSRERHRCPEGLGRPAPDLDQDRALQDIGGLDARVRVAGHAIVRRNLRGYGHFRKARQEIDWLQRHSLDGWLLRNGQDDEDRRDERGKDEHLFEHGYPYFMCQQRGCIPL